MKPEQENKWEEDLRELQRHTPKKGLFSKRINFLFSKLRDQFENHENKLKDIDQEISKLRSVNDSLILSSNSLTEQRDRLNEKNDSLEQEISRLKEEIDKKRGVSEKY